MTLRKSFHAPFIDFQILVILNARYWEDDVFSKKKISSQKMLSYVMFLANIALVVIARGVHPEFGATSKIRTNIDGFCFSNLQTPK